MTQPCTIALLRKYRRAILDRRLGTTAVPCALRGHPLSDSESSAHIAPVRRTRFRGYRRDEGVALVLALLFIVLLSAIVVEYCYEMQVEATFVGSQSDELQAYVAAKSAIASARALLAQDVLAAAGGGPAPSSEGAVTKLDPWYLGVPYQEINEAIMQARITDAGGKLNLNALIDRENDEVRPEVESILRALFSIQKVEQDPTDAIIDWLDTNEDTQGSNGAESDTYQSLTIPYSCKNGPMSSIEELLLIKGITPEVYFGDPLNGVPALTDLLTVYGDDKGKVNINTANEFLLEAIGEGVDPPQPGLSKLVVPRQDQDPFLTEDAIEGAGISKAAAKWLTVKSTVFRVEGQGMMGDLDPVKVLIVAYVKKDAGAGGGASASAGLGNTLLDWRVIR